MPSRKTPQAPAAPAAPTAEQPPVPADPQTVLPLFCTFTDLGEVRALPEAPTGDSLTLGQVEFAPGTIEQFADADGRTMRIANVGGNPHKYPAPDSTEPQPEQED